MYLQGSHKSAQSFTTWLQSSGDSTGETPVSLSKLTLSLRCSFPCRSLSALQPLSFFPCIQRGHHTGPCFCPACCLETFCWITKLCYQVLTERLPWLVEIRGSHACFAHWIVRSESATLPKHLCMLRTQASTLYWGCSIAFSLKWRKLTSAFNRWF